MKGLPSILLCISLASCTVSGETELAATMLWAQWLTTGDKLCAPRPLGPGSSTIDGTAGDVTAGLGNHVISGTQWMDLRLLKSDFDKHIVVFGAVVVGDPLHDMPISDLAGGGSDWSHIRMHLVRLDGRQTTLESALRGAGDRYQTSPVWYRSDSEELLACGTVTVLSDGFQFRCDRDLVSLPAETEVFWISAEIDYSDSSGIFRDCI